MKNTDGGNYWTTSISCISRYFKVGEKQIILDKIDDLLNRYTLTKAKVSKLMYERNIEILHNFEDFEFKEYKPSLNLTYIAKPNSKSIININEIPVQVRPQHVYTYNENNIEKIGAIWFIAKKGGFTPPEIGIFAEALFEYLDINYSKKYEINPIFCIAQDVTSLIKVNQEEIFTKEIPSLLNTSITAIKEML